MNHLIYFKESNKYLSLKKIVDDFKRLLRIITRRYKSFKSEVAKRPPSNGTKGRNSGGITGTVLMIIHSGRFSIFLLAERKAQNH